MKSGIVKVKKLDPRYPNDGVTKSGLLSIFSKRSTVQSAENRRKMYHRFWLRLRHAVILISNVRTSASKKINEMALIRTLTVSTTAFKRMKKNSTDSAA